MTEPAEIRLDPADVLAELVLGTMAREVEMDEDMDQRGGDHPVPACTRTHGSASRRNHLPADPSRLPA